MIYSKVPCKKCGKRAKLVKYRDDLISVAYRITCPCGNDVRQEGIIKEDVKKQVIDMWDYWNRETQ